MRRRQVEGSASDAQPKQAQSVPPALPLRTGDRLTRPEFERRYLANPHIKKAELVEGVTQVREPVGFYTHGRPHSLVSGILFTYAAYTPGVCAVVDPTVRLDRNNEPQPDVALLIEAAADGQSHVDKDGYIAGAPELVLEVAASSATRDLQRKFHAYWRNGVREYVVWRTLDKRIDWFELASGQFEPKLPDSKGLIHSTLFPGLCLAVPALLNNQIAEALEALHEGIGSAPHKVFAADLESRLAHSDGPIEGGTPSLRNPA
ncbi:MAG: Uma2 family endonuclease [Gammaproteobacteria bacterium]|nr:Uma2 family endonuclease [Gammaproteobacteria bacterium]MDE0273637.1 Uma2 family endonuclease [Gammaproteobacteria bacterium]